MIDFKKLNDPVHQEQMRAQRHKQELKLQEQSDRISNMLHELLGKIDDLPDNERRFIRSIHQRHVSFGPLSTKQLNWLEQIHTKHLSSQEASEEQPVSTRRFCFQPRP